MEYGNINSVTYQIKKNRISTSTIIAIIVVIIGIVLILFGIFSSNSSPKQKTPEEEYISSFIETLNNPDYDKVMSYINIYDLVLFESYDNDVNRFVSESVSFEEQSDYGKEVLEEAIAYKQQHIGSTIEQIKIDKVVFEITNIDIVNIYEHENISKLDVSLNLKIGDSVASEKMTFYIMKIDDLYHIIYIDGEKYF